MCKLPNCRHQMHVESPGNGPFSGPAYLTRTFAHSHQVILWVEHYRMLVVKRSSGNINVISPKIGLHPLVRAYTDNLFMTKLEPKEISGKLGLGFIQSHPI
jgi:hypothetical protein